MSLSKDFVEFIECLNRRAVEYLLVGGHALAFHGLPRFTKDIDFWVRSTNENAARTLLALEDFGFIGTDITAEDFSTEGRIVQLGVAPNRIDLVTKVDGIEFDEAYNQRVKTTYRGLDLLVLSLPMLIRNKQSTGRPQDALDAKSLAEILSRQGS